MSDLFGGSIPRPAPRPASLPPFVRIVRDAAAYAEHVQTRSAIRSQDDVVRLLSWLQSEEVEVFVVIALDTRSNTIAVQEVTRGLVDASLVHPREVFRAAVALGATSIIIAHNHPSGDPTPSEEDRAVTRQIVAAGQLLGITVYDHVILGSGRFVSFSATGLL